MMDPRDRFFTDEFSRYAAECRRMARLARPPKTTAATPAASLLNPAGWLALAQTSFGTPAKRTLLYATISGRR
jgi:hypothetical protein